MKKYLLSLSLLLLTSFGTVAIDEPADSFPYPDVACPEGSSMNEECLKTAKANRDKEINLANAELAKKMKKIADEYEAAKPGLTSAELTALRSKMWGQSFTAQNANDDAIDVSNANYKIAAAKCCEED